jgi:long-chain acyl-CoA synthetase
MESSTTSPAVGPEIGGLTLGEALRRTAANHPDTVAVRTPDDSVSLTWSELLRRVERLAGGLAKLGVARGDTVAIMLSNRPEFHIADLAAVLLGATPFSIYLTYPPAEIEYLMRDAACRVAIVEQAHTGALLEASKALGELEHVIVVDGEPPEGATSLAAVEASNPDFDPASEVPETAPEDLVTLIYTSGTTGPPKGVQLSHRNVMAGVETFEQIVAFGPGSRVISWLPAAHIAERMAHHYIPVVLGGTITCCPNPREVVSYLPQVRPNWFFAVPRIWEKLKAGLEAMQAAQPEEQQRPVQEALAAAVERVRLMQRGEPVPAELEETVARADTEMFSKLRAMLGLDQAVAVNVGAAPTPLEVLEFFHALGIELAELWGMSETCGSGSCNRSGAVKLGTVGPPSPGVEMKIGPDGELLVRGDCVMVGYRGAPDKTAEALDGEGWLHTGDIASIDDDGYVRIVDRKKEIIINSAGKNMSPANIEAAIKSASPLIGQAVCIGDRRPYNTALIVLDADYVPQWATRQGIDSDAFEDLAGDERVIAAVQEAVEQANQNLSRVEQIKKFTIVPGDWVPGGQELTPTMKLKRAPIAAKYEAQIDGMYV